MKKQSCLETFLLLAVTFLFALVLTGCASKESTPEEDLAACRAVMDELQSGDSYHIATRREFVEDGTHTELEHWKSGDDWLDIFCPSTTSVLFATLHKDGQTFDNSKNQVESRKDDIKWNPYPYEAREIPSWLYNCRWEDQQVQLLSAAQKAGGRIVTVQFLTPYDLAGEYTSKGCTVAFHFDRSGDFEKAVMNVVYQYNEKEDEQLRWIDTMTILSTDPEKVAAKIDGEYQRALEQNP